MSKFINDVESIMELFSKVDGQKNAWSSRDADGNLWVAVLMPSKEKLIVSFKSKEESTPSTIVINKDEREKLYSTFKKLYNGDENHSKHTIDETCSAGATCAGNIATYAKNVGKPCKRKNESEQFDVKLFKESIINDMPCVSRINEHVLRYFENNGKFYMGIDNSLVKTYDKHVMVEAVDKVITDKLSDIELLEDYSCYEMDILMEDVTANPMQPIEAQSTTDNQQDEERNRELLDKVDSGEEVSYIDDATNEIEDDFQVVGKDDTYGKFIIKNNATKDIKIVNMDDLKDTN